MISQYCHLFIEIHYFYIIDIKLQLSMISQYCCHLLIRDIHFQHQISSYNSQWYLNTTGAATAWNSFPTQLRQQQKQVNQNQAAAQRNQQPKNLLQRSLEQRNPKIPSQRNQSPSERNQSQRNPSERNQSQRSPSQRNQSQRNQSYPKKFHKSKETKQNLEWRTVAKPRFFWWLLSQNKLTIPEQNGKDETKIERKWFLHRKTFKQLSNGCLLVATKAIMMEN